MPLRPGARRELAVVAADPPVVVPGKYLKERIVSFAGKPPKGLAVGDLMVMRSVLGGAATALRVEGVVLGSDSYSIQFETALTDDFETFEPDAYEFQGPMTRALRPRDHDRNPTTAFAGAKITLDGLDNAARDLIRPGRPCLIEDEREIEDPVLGEVLEVLPGASLQVVLASAEGLADFKRGWTRINLNAVIASHGETKSPKTLGSGDGERGRQSFTLSARRVSFIPSSVAETGVAPDMDVAVDNAVWSYRDLIDPTAEGSESFSTSLNEDDTLTIHFRRRLPTGTNNVAVRRYRTGVGADGAAVPARAFTKPAKKNRHVKAITQPFAATGGAEREPVEDIRVNAPSRLAANGRAVSIEDFGRLCRRRSDIWQAAARAVTNPTVPYDVEITVVPSNGGAVGPTLRTELVEFIEARAIPGTRIGIVDFSDVNFLLDTTIYVKTEVYDRTEVQAAAHAALIARFALEVRALGQPVYIAEAVAALEAVDGVETVTVGTFALKTGSAPILRSAKTAGADSAFFPFENQVISVARATASTDFTVTVEALI